MENEFIGKYYNGEYEGFLGEDEKEFLKTYYKYVDEPNFDRFDEVIFSPTFIRLISYNRQDRILEKNNISGVMEDR